MNRTIRTTLGFVVAGALTLTMAPAALAAPTTAPASAGATAQGAADFEDTWGRYYSRNRLAYARGDLAVDGDEDGNTVEVSGRIHDRDFRSASRGGKCGYVIFEGVFLDEDEDDWSRIKRYKHCGSGGSRYFEWDEDDVVQLRVKVCQTNPRAWRTSDCGRWRELDLGF
ncbi:hypothetical protein [Streptosporangium sp. KLBMP 9127]|nr:hypothetical protein [Streptosporangium sp. KLBMP 9127]